MTSSNKTASLVSAFQATVLAATRSMCKAMATRESIDILEWMLDVLFLRNSHLFETVAHLLEGGHIVGAELLLRSSLEGAVSLEWCLVDPVNRAQRFHGKAMTGTLDLLRTGFLKRSGVSRQSVEHVVSYCTEKSLKPPPDFRQMIESLDTYAKGCAYSLYKYLSKSMHGVCVEWGDYLDCSGTRPRVCQVEHPSAVRVRTCRAMATFLQMRNIVLISEFDKVLRYPGCRDLEDAWQELHVILSAQERKEHDERQVHCEGAG